MATPAQVCDQGEHTKPPDPGHLIRLPHLALPVHGDVTTGAGVGPLLRDLSGLGGPSPVYVATEVYPDLPVWLGRAGRRRVPGGLIEPPGMSNDDMLTRHLAAIAAYTPGLVFLERPALRGSPTDELPMVRQLCDAVADRGAFVLVDESNANYCPPDYSAATLLADTGNLVVLRGISKAFGLGGIRFGVCLSSNAATSWVREVTPPLQASSFSLRVGAAILAAATDPSAGLRARIGAHRRRVIDALANTDVGPVAAAMSDLPYVLFASTPQPSLNRLREAGIQGKLHMTWGSAGPRSTAVGRVSIPLSETRLREFETRLADILCDATPSSPTEELDKG